jgi:hypothetical protein
MGRGLAFICTGMVFIFGIIQLGISNRHNSETGININYANWVQARNVAASGADVAIMELINDKTWNEPLELQLGGYTANVSVIRPAEDPDLGADQKRIVSVSTIGNRSATVTSLLQERSPLPDVEGAIGIYSKEVDLTFSGSGFTIDGTDGETDPAKMKYGIAAGNKEVYEVLISKLSVNQKNKITGINGTSSIGQVKDRNQELIELIAWYKEIAKVPGKGNYFDGSVEFTGDDTFGSADSLQVTYVANTMTIKGNVDGAGILIAENLDLRGGGGSLNFNGLIIVMGKANIVGNIDIEGAVLFGGEKPLIYIEAKGSFDIKYNSQSLEGISPYLKSSGVPVNLPLELVSIFE